MIRYNRWFLVILFQLFLICNLSNLEAQSKKKPPQLKQFAFVAEVVITDAEDTASTQVILHEDKPKKDKRTKIKKFVLDKDQLTSKDQSDLFDLITSGNRVRIKAKRLPSRSGARLALRGKPSKDGEAGIDAINVGESNIGSIPEGNTAREVTQNRSLIVFTVAFDGYTPVTNASADSAFFTGSNSANYIIQDSSYNKLGFSIDKNADGRVDVFGPYTVTRPTDPCDWNQFMTMANAINQQALLNGVDASTWQHKAYVLPVNGMSCPFVGRAHVGCSSSSCHSQYDGNRMSWATLFPHELGHNLGFSHSAVDLANDGTLDSEYGDHSCWMGNPSLSPASNAPHRIQQGWLASTNTTDGSTGGTFRLASLDVLPGSTTNTHVVTLPDANKYFISYRRQATGTYDANLGAGYRPLVSIHRHAGGYSKTTFLGALGIGGSRVLSNGYRVSVANISGDYADITIGGDCIPGAAIASISPATQTTGGAGNALAYTVSVSNKDNAFCPPATFNLVANLPGTGWTGPLDSASLTIPGGGSASTQVVINSPAGTADGTYNFSVAVSESSSALHNTNTGGAYVIDASPDAPTSVAVRKDRKLGVIVSWVASVSPQISSYSVYESVNNGAYSLLGSTSLTKYTKGAITCGIPYKYYVVANNAYGASSAASNIASITSSCGGGGKR